MLTSSNDHDDLTPTTDMEKALIYALRAHVGQTRKGDGSPYYGHLLAVAARVLEYGGKDDEGVAALLHDAIEDQGGPERREDIHRRFGDRVVAIVDGCTDTDEMPKPAWKERKERYLAHITTADESVRRVSLADKICNVRSAMFGLRRKGQAFWEPFHGSKEEELWYYRELVKAFRQHGRDALLDELDRLTGQLAELAETEC
jgi:(p)ppGpp synthase/HD superfamily hydrolase